MKTINIDEINNGFSQIFDSVLNTWKWIQINWKKWNAILITLDEYDNLNEHLHVSKCNKVMHKVHNFNELTFESHDSISSLKQSIDG